VVHHREQVHLRPSGVAAAAQGPAVDGDRPPRRASQAHPAVGQQQEEGMMARQAPRSGLVMGFDDHIIAGSRACSYIDPAR
jgi:hypothetical protein